MMRLCSLDGLLSSKLAASLVTAAATVAASYVSNSAS